MAGKKKEVKIVLTPEQRREQDLEAYLRDRTEYLPEPTYTYNIGDRVSIGALEDVYICNIINNKVYEIDYTSINNNYGNPIRNEHNKMFVSWLQIRPYNENKPTLIKNDDIHLSYAQMTMGSIFSKVYFFGTNFDPEYQRDYVWNIDDKIALIDSIFNNVDIGKFVFIHKEYDEDYLYEILDGKQRIRAILDYYENRFAYKGKYFNDLSASEQDHIEYYHISVAEVSRITKEQILRYFIMVNKHGRVMSKEQIAKVENMLENIEKQ